MDPIPDQPIPPKPTRRRWRIIAAVLVVIPLCAAAWERLSGGLALQEYLRDQIARGAVFEVAKLVPPQPVDGDNGLLEIVALKKEGDRYDRFRASVPRMEQYVEPGVLRRITALENWEWSEWRDSTRVLQTNDWQRFGRDLAEVTNIVTKLGAALEKPGFSTKTDYERGFMDLPMEAILAIRWPEKFLTASILDGLRRGDAASVERDVTALLRLVDGAGKEPLLITGMIRQAIMFGLFQAVWQVLQEPAWDPALLARWQGLLEEWNFQTAAMKALHFERAVSLEHCRRMGANPKLRDEYAEMFVDAAESGLGFGIQTESGWLFYHVQLPLWTLLWQDHDCLAQMRCFERLIACQSMAMELSWRQSRDQWGEGSGSLLAKVFGEPEERGLLGRTRHLFSSRTLIDESLLKASAKAEVQRRMLVAVLALHRFRSANQRWPENLAALVPGYLKQVPTDPLDGAPLRYRLNGSGSFDLYSVGENCVDDGGDPTAEDPSEDYGFWDGRDALWPRVNVEPAANTE